MGRCDSHYDTVLSVTPLIINTSPLGRIIVVESQVGGQVGGQKTGQPLRSGVNLFCDLQPVLHHKLAQSSQPQDRYEASRANM